MGWKKLKRGIEFLEKPCLGNVKPKQGERFMALCVSPSSTRGNYIGLVRRVIDREGSENVLGFTDSSKLVIAESRDLLDWLISGDLKIKKIDEIVEKFQKEQTRFLGLEDPDIAVDEKGIMHVYFTIAYKYLKEEKYDIYLGHAFGKNLKNLEATNPVLGPIGKDIFGFKELAPNFVKDGAHLNLAEGVIAEKSESVSVISVVRADDWNKNWIYEKTVLNPRKMKYSWCAGDVSPCRILPREMINAGKNCVLIINGREKTIVKGGKKTYGKFRPGLALYNPSTGEIPWVNSKPLFEDPDATKITFASDAVPFDEEHFILYAHVNDSFVRVYKIEYEEVRKSLKV